MTVFFDIFDFVEDQITSQSFFVENQSSVITFSQINEIFSNVRY